jgi:LuxR family transcriptional regulator, activator of tox operons
MDVRPIERLPTRAAQFRRGLCLLVEQAGTAGFAERLFSAAVAATDCQHLTAFRQAPGQPPRVILAMNTGPSAAWACAERYVAHHWHRDVANCADIRVGDSGMVAIRSTDADITDHGYRHDCYTSVRIVERFSILAQDAEGTLRLNFYRDRAHGGFDATEREGLVDTAELLLALLRRHEGAARPAAPALLRLRLRTAAPALTEREVDVCAGIVCGQTSEGIALTLGVSINTVRTYRKRAYARLGITSENELMRIVLG